MTPRTDLAELVTEAAGRAGDRVAVVDTGTEVVRTWSELEAEVSRVAAGLAVAGGVAGRRVLICLPNRVELVTAWLAVLRAQAVAVPVDPRSSPAELVRVLADSGARLAVGDGGTAPRLRAALPEGVRLVVVAAEPAEGEIGWPELAGTGPQPVPPLPDPEKLAALLYTSGTSGRPRGAMLTHRALLADIEMVARVEPPMVRPDDVVLGVLPLFHVYGLNAVLGAVLRQAATLVLSPEFHPDRTLDLVARHGVTVLPVAPPVFAHWLGAEPVPDLAERLAGVRLVLSGSASLEPGVADRFTEATGIPVHQGYGLTEAAPVVTSTMLGAGAPSSSVGAPLPGVELRILDERGDPVTAGDPGEIWLRGANLFSGYWPDGADGPGEDGWWATGDVGLLDGRGDLRLVDRVEELVVVSGFSVYPQEVEAVLDGVDGVTATAVIGVPDESTGEAVVAYLVAPGRDADEVVAEARARCADELARFKQPVRVEVVAELPGTVTGRVQKGRLRGLERRRRQDLL